MDVTSYPIFDVILLTILLAIAVCLYVDWKFQYWKRRGVHVVSKPSVIYGHISRVFWGYENGGILYHDIYKMSEGHPLVGTYEFHSPLLIVRDPDLVKKVLAENFNSFHDSKIKESLQHDPIIKMNPFALSGKSWKEERSTLSSKVSGAGLQILPEFISEIYKEMSKYIDKHRDDVEVHELVNTFTCETVAKLGWGIEGGGFSEKKSYVQKMFDGQLSTMGSSLLFFAPFFGRLFNFRFFPKNQEEFFFDITKQSVKAAMGDGKGALKRTLLNALLKAKAKQLGEDASRKLMEDAEIFKITCTMCTFYLDAYETIGFALSYILYSLMRHPLVQNKVREEILNMDEEEITIESVNRLEYMEMTIYETLRLHPVIPYLNRRCTKECSLGGTVIEEGTGVIVPVLALHMDPEYFKEPEVFDPEHFTQDEVKRRKEYTFMPFGQGPRQCLGMKYSMAEMKLLLCHLLREYEIVPPETHAAEDIRPSHESVFFYVPESPLYVRFRKIN